MCAIAGEVVHFVRSGVVLRREGHDDAEGMLFITNYRILLERDRGAQHSTIACKIECLVQHMTTNAVSFFNRQIGRVIWVGRGNRRVRIQIQRVQRAFAVAAPGREIRAS